MGTEDCILLICLLTFLGVLGIWTFILRGIRKRKAQGAGPFYCLNGHKTWDLTHQFCTQCGEKVATEFLVFCPNGHEVREPFAFCPICGTKVSEEEREKFFRI